MTSNTFFYFCLVASVTMMSSVQIIMKYRMGLVHGVVPADPGTLVRYVGGLLRDPWIYLVAFCLIGASFLWYYGLSRLPLNVTFAFTALSYPIVFVVSWLAFKESITLPTLLGYVAIIGGILLIGWGAE